jgi:hypothetical protein
MLSRFKVRILTCGIHSGEVGNISEKNIALFLLGLALVM